MSDAPPGKKKTSRIQQRNRGRILDAALAVFSTHGFRGTTLDQIAAHAGLSKPNILYYFEGKEQIHATLLNQLMETWLAPLQGLDAGGEPLDEILRYVRRKLEMSREFPRESRLFAIEIIQGAPNLHALLSIDLKALVDEKAALLDSWIKAGRIAPVQPYHLIFSIWALTQHYADFDIQIHSILPDHDPYEDAFAFVDQIYRRALTP